MSERESDIWRLGEGGYDPSNFYVASKDKQGHSQLVHIRVPGPLVQQAQQLIVAREVPAYRSIQDSFRDGWVHRLHWLSQNRDAPQLSRLARLVLAQAEIEHRQAVYDQVEQIMDSLQTAVSQAIKFGDRAGAAQMVSEARERLQDTLSQAEWRSVEQHLTAHFGRITAI